MQRNEPESVSIFGSQTFAVQPTRPLGLSFTQVLRVLDERLWESTPSALSSKGIKRIEISLSLPVAHLRRNYVLSHVWEDSGTIYNRFHC